jgi:DNA-binding transcriptional MerR regulator
VATYRTIDLARAAGIHPNTVRAYERIGFISRAPRAANGYRVFGEKHLCQLRICRCIFGGAFLGRELRRASLRVIRAAEAWDLPRARQRAEEYLARVERELAVARQTADILARWARGTRAAEDSRTYTRRAMAKQIGVTEEALRNWERNGLLCVPRTGPNRVRCYRAEERERLRVIYMLLQSGFSMSAIHHSLLRYDEGDPAGVVEALGTVESGEGGTWTSAGDHWIEALEEARRGAEQVLFLLEEARAGKRGLREPSQCTPPFLLPLRWGKRGEEEPPMPWQDALRTVLELTYERVEKEGIRWALIDAGAARLQGARVPPHLSEGFCIMAEQAAGVLRFAELLLAVTPEDEEVTRPPRGAVLASTQQHTVFVGSLPTDKIVQRLPADRSAREGLVPADPGRNWYWAAWTINRADVSVVYAPMGPDGHPNHQGEQGGVWEMDPAVWPHVRRVPFDGYSVPVMPLEILAAHYLAGDHMESPEEQFYNTAEIARVFRAEGYDRALLEWAIRPADLPRFDAILHGQERARRQPAPNAIFVQVVDRPARKLILKRGIRATHYYEYCDEVGCEVEDELAGIQEVVSEDRLLGFWLPPHLRRPGTSAYVMGVEAPADYRGPVPPGFDVIDLPPCQMMFFQGPPTEGEPIRDPVRDAMDTYDVKFHGYEWADEDGPRFQLPPRGDRGYIEARPVRPLRAR